MKIKQLLKSKIGEKRIIYIKGFIKIIKNKKKFKKGSLNFNKNVVYDIKEYYSKGYDVFCGYYDYMPLSFDKTKLLCQRVKKSLSNKAESTEIGYFDIQNSNKFNVLFSSKAWCWQQGSRLHWSKINSNYIFFNDVEDGNYCTRVFDVENKKIIRNIIPALYDISFDEKYGININFSRLQRLRPGYGYSNLEDDSINEKAPKDDGLFLIDLISNEKKLLVSLERLAKDVDPDIKFNHYLNHISFSPNSRRVMFFHLWTDNKWPGWMTRLCIYDLEKDKLIILEDKDLVSHYSWINNDSLLITCANRNTKQQFYQVYYIDSKMKRKLNTELLKRDGHPTMINDRAFISDTYPDNESSQSVFLYNKENKIELLKIYADPKLDGEYRCDLHPKVNKTEIIIDTTYKKCCRRIIVFSIKNIFKEE